MRRWNYAYVGFRYHARADGNGGDMPIQSSSSGKRCAYMASSGGGFGEDKLPV